jgi:hypothetical protein
LATLGLFLASSSIVPLAVTGRASAASSVPIEISDFAAQQQVLAAVDKAQSLRNLPAHVVPSWSTLENGADFGLQGAVARCPGPTAFSSKEDISKCTFGDSTSKQTVMLTGDSRAQMWFDTLNAIAEATHVKLVLLAKTGCPSPPGNYPLNNNGNLTATRWPACTAWDRFVASTIKSLKPSLVIISCSDILLSASKLNALPNATISAAFTSLFRSIPKQTKFAVIGGFPDGGQANPTLCLSKGPNNISTCAYPESSYVIGVNDLVREATTATGGTYIDQTAWLCAKTCPAIIAGIIPYTIDSYHIDDAYAHYLTGVLWAALEHDLP